MIWQNLNYSKKGAVIGLIIGVFLFFAHQILQSSIKDVKLDTLNSSPIFIVSSILIDWPYAALSVPISTTLFWTSAILCGPSPTTVPTATWLEQPQCLLFNIYPALSFVGYFITVLLLGFFVGWIIGKIKFKNNK